MKLWLKLPFSFSSFFRSAHVFLSSHPHPLSHQVSPAQPTGGRRRRTVDDDPDERRQRFLERNRAAASRCRQKRKVWVSSLEKKAEELSTLNVSLSVSGFEESGQGGSVGDPMFVDVKAAVVSLKEQSLQSYFQEILHSCIIIYKGSPNLICIYTVQIILLLFSPLSIKPEWGVSLAKRSGSFKAAAAGPQGLPCDHASEENCLLR